MNKTIKVDFTEQSKAVTANVKIEYSGDKVPTNDEILEETQALFDKASQYSALKTMQKR